MADTGEDREIRQRITANQAERVAEAKKLGVKLKRSSAANARKKPGLRRNKPQSQS